MAYSSITKPEDYFNTILWTGDTSTTRSFTGVGFQPDWVWSKQRSTTRGHQLMDSVRGANKTLESHSSNAEGNQFSNGYLTSFDSDGFSATQGSSAFLNFNQNSGTYVAWNWLAGGTASSNTDGSITSSVSANTTAGFSIVTTTGTGANATIGHGLGAAPAMIIGKRRDSGSSQWRVYNKNLSSASHILFLDTTGAEQSGNSATWNNTAPTSSVFSVGTSGDVNASSGTFVFYCFAEKKGYSKFGSYTGNGNNDGTFVYTGFKPAWVVVKASSRTGSWCIQDNKRPGYNPENYPLFAEDTGAEDTSDDRLDLLSNGFKIRDGDATSYNESGSTYIYMAFAENPFVGNVSGTAVPVTAR